MSLRFVGPNLDAILLKRVQANWNLSIPYFLCASYLYYELNQSLYTDETFDWLCSEMLDRYSSLRHRHKKYVTKEMLEAGTGHNLNWNKIPSIIKGAARQMLLDYYARFRKETL